MQMSRSIQKTKTPFPQLKEIPQPPKKLFTQGTLPPPKTKFLTVVGSRRFSSYGKEACEKLIAGLSGYEISIVSGLALGIDAIAHRSALKAGLHTIAVPGSGLDEKVLYPATNKNLAKQIVEKGGLLLSEFEPDFKATTWSFPRRNRIMAGLSDAVLIIEAQERSGTLITARMALDYNKDLLAVPGSIFNTSSFGTNRLLTQGATPIVTSDDILTALHIEKKEENEDALEESLKDCSEEEILIMNALTEPIPRNELIRISKLPSEQVNSILSLLEIKGLIKETGGIIYRKI